MMTAWRGILQKARTIAVVGLSANPNRPSFDVARYLQSAGYRILPINPTLKEAVLGETPYASLAALPFPVDILDIFRRTEEIPSLVQEILRLSWSPALVCFQLGIDISPEDRRRLEAKGMVILDHRCLKVEHARA